MSDPSTLFGAATSCTTPPHRTLYFFDIVEDYPEIGGVADVSARIRRELQRLFGPRLVAVRSIADQLGCGNSAEPYLPRERRAIERLAALDPASTFLIPNFQSPVGRMTGLPQPKIVNIVHDVQFAKLPDLFTAEQHRWLDRAWPASARPRSPP